MREIIKACVAMICITAMEIFALYQQIDGQLLSLTVAVIAGLGGYIAGKKT